MALKAERRDQKRNKKLVNRRHKSNIKSIWLGINARLKRLSK